MIDIHTHILSDIDDGADTLETSLMMCAAAFESGTTAILATPHFMEGNYERACKKRVYEEVKKLNDVLSLQNNRSCPKIYPGCEALISLELPELLASGECATMNASQYLLVELPMSSIPHYTDEVFYEIQLQGITPVLAHPERYSDIISDPKCINHFLDKGILVQINSGSLTGRMGKSVQQTALSLLNQRAVHFVSTDAHNMRSRKPRMKKAYDIVMKHFGKDNAELLFKINAENLIHNNSIQQMQPFRKNYFKMLLSPLYGILSGARGS